MYVGVCRLTLVVAGSRSLKDKRSVLRKIKDRVANKLHVYVAEVGGQDTWQRAVLGFAVVSADGAHVESVVDSVVRFVSGLGVAHIVDENREILQFEDGDFEDVGWVKRKFE